MKGLFHFILSHSIFIAFCASALSLQTLQLLSLPLNTYLLAFIFFAALGSYNAYWIVSKVSFNRYNAPFGFIKKNRSTLLVMFSACIGMLVCMRHLHLVMFNIAITFLLLALYTIPILPFKALYFTRKAGFLKTLLLAFAWTIVTTLIPLQISIFEMGTAALLVFFNRFLFMLMLCIIFDNRDAAVDKIRGLQSLATDLKPYWLHFLVGIIFISHTGGCIAMKYAGTSLPQVAALIITGLITLAFYYSSLQKRGYLFYYFGVDGLMLLSALLTALAGVYGVKG